jgi:hypothetical protein
MTALSFVTAVACLVLVDALAVAGTSAQEQRPMLGLTVRGIVLEADGKRATSGTVIAVVRSGLSTTTISATVESTGQFTIRGLPEGQCRFAVQNGRGEMALSSDPRNPLSQNDRLALQLQAGRNVAGLVLVSPSVLTDPTDAPARASGRMAAGPAAVDASVSQAAAAATAAPASPTCPTAPCGRACVDPPVTASPPLTFDVREIEFVPKDQDLSACLPGQSGCTPINVLRNVSLGCQASRSPCNTRVPPRPVTVEVRTQMRDTDFFAPPQCDPLACGIPCDGKNRSFCMLMGHECSHRHDIPMWINSEFAKYLSNLAGINSQCKPCAWKMAQEIEKFAEFTTAVGVRLNDPAAIEPPAEAAACQYYLRTCR